MRRPQTRRPAAVALAALTAATAVAAGALSGCSVLQQKHFEDDATVAQKVTSVRFDSGNGKVEVTASADVTTATVHRRVNYRGDKPGGTSFHVDGGVLTLAGCGRHCSVDYDVKVPAGLAVAGGTSNGSVTLTGVGPVDVHTSNGRIAVRGAKGAVKLRTSNGNVDVTGAHGGDLDAQTSNGRLTIATATPQNVRAHTSNGNLTVTTPPAAYRISASTSNGKKKVAFRSDPAGTYRLDLSTSNGNLTVAPPAG